MSVTISPLRSASGHRCTSFKISQNLIKKQYWSLKIYKFVFQIVKHFLSHVQSKQVRRSCRATGKVGAEGRCSLTKVGAAPRGIFPSNFKIIEIIVVFRFVFDIHTYVQTFVCQPIKIVCLFAIVWSHSSSVSPGTARALRTPVRRSASYGILFIHQNAKINDH